MRNLSGRWSPSSGTVGIGTSPGRRPATHPAVEGRRARVKRNLDAVLAAGTLVLAAPIFLTVSTAIAFVDGRPVFYSQTRRGRDGRPFRIFKFRTMRPNAEDGNGPVWAVGNDPRCTRLGAWLRRLGLDELPQLWNVLGGDMSIVGPRPERPRFAERFAARFPEYPERERVRPGITGYAQIHGWRGDTDLYQRLRHDLHYVRRWSLMLDLRILLGTLRYGWSERTRDGLDG